MNNTTTKSMAKLVCDRLQHGTLVWDIKDPEVANELKAAGLIYGTAGGWFLADGWQAWFETNLPRIEAMIASTPK